MQDVRCLTTQAHSLYFLLFVMHPLFDLLGLC